MDRDHFGIPKLFTLQVLALFFLAPIVWGQTYPYAVLVEGAVTACKTKKYSKAGRLSETGSEETSCGNIYKSSSAQNDSTADLSSDSMNGSMALTAFNSKSRGSARSIANDTVTLIPPSGYNQNFVDFIVHDEYEVRIDNSNGGSGYAQLCWGAPKLWKRSKCIQYNKDTNGEVNWAARLKKSSAGFKFAISKGTQLGASVTGSGSWGGLYDTRQTLLSSNLSRLVGPALSHPAWYVKPSDPEVFEVRVGARAFNIGVGLGVGPALPSRRKTTSGA
jgi:hypothetical protein